MPAETATLAPPCPGPLNVLCGELRGDSSDESMGCYSPRSMNAAKLLLSASRANIGIRKGNFDAHRRGEAKAHGAEAARIDPAARVVKLVVLGGKHLMLSDI